ncbi:MAG: tyrosine-protein phosphatase [Saccharospirillum sp.]|nr:tyrosine-protein phosphatase [Saccharospirillum sp.]
MSDSPGSGWSRFRAWCDAMFLDHGVLRFFWNGPQEVVPGVYRSNQPSPWVLRRLARKGLRTVISLRGLNQSAAASFEREACEQLGMDLIAFKMSSRGAPKPERIMALADLFRRVEYPVLLHCKSGADRAGFATALYLLLSKSGSIDQARDQLSWRYLHFKGAKTGRLDAFLAAYQQAHDRSGIEFLPWVEQVYDPNEINQNFKPKGWSSWLVDKVLRRE